MNLANDNLTPDSEHHAECLRLIQDLHDLLVVADRHNLRLEDSTESLDYAFDWNFWSNECAKILAHRR